MIPYGKHYIDQEDINAVIKVLKSDNLTQGSLIAVFEKSLYSSMVKIHSYTNKIFYI